MKPQLSIQLICLALMAGSVSDAHAQGLLNKAMKKAQEAKEMLQDKVSTVVAAEKGSTSSYTADNNDDDTATLSSSRSEKSYSKNSAEDIVPKRRSSSVSWDTPVSPSTSNRPIPLLNEFPAVPSGAAVANPTEEAQILYYQAIKKVTMRAEELNAGSEACEDAWLEEWRNKMNDQLSGVFGLTPEEMRKLDDENTSEAERERLQKKMEENMRKKYNLGQEGDLEARMSALEKQNKGKDPDQMAEQMMLQSLEKMRPFFKANESEVKYLSGMSADAYCDMMIAQAKEEVASGGKKVSNPQIKKVEEYAKEQEKKDGKAFTTREKAFQQKVQAETMRCMQEAQKEMTGIGSMSDLFGGINQMTADISSATADMSKLQQGLKVLAEKELDMNTALDFDVHNYVDKLSSDNVKKLEAIKKKIEATDKPEEYDPLFNEAIAIISNFRLSVGQKISSEIQRRFAKVKELMPGFIKAQREAVADGILPECALWRAPLNAVISTGDLLNDAYTGISESYPSMVCTSVINTYNLTPTEVIFYPENYVGIGATGIQLFIMDTDTKKYYSLENGKKTPVDQSKFDKAVKGDKPSADRQKSKTWTSHDGKRKAYFNTEGGFLQLPEGDVISSYDLQSLDISNDHTIVWYTLDISEKQVKLIKNLYKI